MRDIVITTITTMIGTLFGWLLAQIQLGRVKVLAQDRVEIINYRDEDTGEVTPYCSGKFDNIKIDMRLIVSNSKSQSISLRNFKVVFCLKNDKETIAMPLKNTTSMKCNPYGVTADDVKCITIDAGNSIDLNVFCFFQDLEKLKQVERIKIEYLNNKLKMKHCNVGIADYSRIKEVRTQEEEIDG